MPDSPDAGPHLARRSTEYIGVRYREELSKYVVEIRPPRSTKKIWLGSYNMAEEAARAFDIGNLRCKRNLPLNFPDSPFMLKEIPSGLSPEDAQIAILKLAKDVAHQYHGKADGELHSTVLQENRPPTDDGDSGSQAMDDECECTLPPLLQFAQLFLRRFNEEAHVSARGRWAGIKNLIGGIDRIDFKVEALQTSFQMLSEVSSPRTIEFPSDKESWPLTGDEDHGYQAMDDEWQRTLPLGVPRAQYARALLRLSQHAYLPALSVFEKNRQSYESTRFHEESWPLTDDGDRGYQAMDDKWKYPLFLDVSDFQSSSFRVLEKETDILMAPGKRLSNVLRLSHALVAIPVDCVELSAMGTGFWRAPEILDAVLNKRERSQTTIDRMPDVYSYAMTCYEVVTGIRPFDTDQLQYTWKFSGETRPDLPTCPEEVGALLKTCLLASKQSARPDWSFVSERLLGEHGINRAANSCKNLWDSLLLDYNAIQDHELKIYNGTISAMIYFEMDEGEKLKNMLPPVFFLEWCQMMETILTANPVEVQSGTTADECTGLSDCEELLCTDDGEDESCESAVTEVEDSTADSYVPQIEPTYTDKEAIDASATLRNLVEDMVQPLLTSLRTRVEEEKKRQQKVLAAEMDKVALMLQDIRRALVHSNEARGKDLPELPSQQISVATGGKRKADMEVDRQAKKQAGNADRCNLLLQNV